MPARYLFGDCTFDVDTGEVCRDAEIVRLEPQPARVLGMLLAADGRLVTRDELRESLWADTNVDFDQSINYCVRQIRVALGDRAASPRFVETLPRRGYRFAVRVEPVDRPVAPRRGPHRGLVAAGLVFAVCGMYFAGVARSVVPTDGAGGVSTARAAIRVAVVPGNEPADPDDRRDLERVLDGLVEQLTSLRQPRLGVVGPITTRPFAARQAPATEVGVELGVDFVLSVSLAGDRGAFAQMIAVPGGEHVFAERFAAGTPVASVVERTQQGLERVFRESSGADPEG